MHGNVFVSAASCLATQAIANTAHGNVCKSPDSATQTIADNDDNVDNVGILAMVFSLELGWLLD